MDLHHGRHSVPPFIQKIVLKGTQTSETAISQSRKTQTKSYGLDELGITLEFTVYKGGGVGVGVATGPTMGNFTCHRMQIS